MAYLLGVLVHSPPPPCLVLFSPGGYINSARFPYLDPVGNPTFYCGIYRKGQLKMGYRPDGACRSIPTLNKFSWVEFFFNFSSRIQRFLSKPSRKNYHLPIFLVDGALKSQTPRFRIGGTSHLAGQGRPRDTHQPFWHQKPQVAPNGNFENF